METHFASPERADASELEQMVLSINRNPVIDGLMQSVGGLLAVLNQHRQILAVNDTLLKMLGFENADTILGLRPGEAINCIHAHEMPGGCGTSQHCSSCGAAISIVSALSSNETMEKTCAATVAKNDEIAEICFKVRASPLHIDDNLFILLFLQDITSQEEWAALERTFFHDINNIVTSLAGNAAMLELQDGNLDPGMAGQIRMLSLRLAKEVAIQGVLAKSSGGRNYRVSLQGISIRQLFTELGQFFTSHPASKDITLLLPEKYPVDTIKTDYCLLLRILTNMLVNAMEASKEGDTITLGFEMGDDHATFSVNNRQTIPENITCRIFQRHFSTKSGNGRGIGTYSMKLFGEKYLRGKVTFSTSNENGTTFRLALPKS
ncbi:MAG: HAMP domain-containing histidine kinase [Proteobacteria bacterium]|nr:HAMP domain-containing histidine kinase [Pseudomonadota bacterium]MBU1739074.1 HAMP domain-containing histidine kinase [Pseudomonadota bacterium]